MSVVSCSLTSMSGPSMSITNRNNHNGFLIFRIPPTCFVHAICPRSYLIGLWETLIMAHYLLRRRHCRFLIRTVVSGALHVIVVPQRVTKSRIKDAWPSTNGILYIYCIVRVHENAAPPLNSGSVNMSRQQPTCGERHDRIFFAPYVAHVCAALHKLPDIPPFDFTGDLVLGI